MTVEPHTDSWYLMDSSFPDLNWARLRIFSSGATEVFDCDGATHRFTSVEEAKAWLSEDEFRPLDALDAEDEREHGIVLAEINVPRADSDLELKPRMYVHRDSAAR